MGSPSIPAGVQTDGMPGFDERDRAVVARTLAAFKEKMDRRLHQATRLHIHFKTHQASPMRRKHSVHARLHAPGVSAKAEHWDWNALTALQKALDSLAAAVEKKLAP